MIFLVEINGGNIFRSLLKCFNAYMSTNIENTIKEVQNS